MNMDKVESVQIDQSILGRMLGYGDVTILGTGLETLRTIASPMSFETASPQRRTKPTRTLRHVLRGLLRVEWPFLFL
jgi:hypothetical protein